MKKVKTIKWDEFFERKQNEMVVFRIIPHKGVTNNTNRKIWKALHKMFEIYDSLPSRVERSGYKFTFREKDAIWFDVIFRVVDGKKTVEFYTATTTLWAKKYREILENRMKVTIEEAELSSLEVPEENTTVHELRYLRHDIFSMKTDATEQTSPIASILSAVDDITEEGDYARLSISSETVSRSAWSKMASYAHDKLSKGKIPQRPRITRDKTLKSIHTVVAGMVNEVYSLLQDTIKAIEKTFYKSDQENSKQKLIEPIAHNDVQKLSSQSRDKQFQPVWKTRIRVAAHTEDKLRRELIASTISGAFAELGDNNELHGVKVNFRGRKMEIIQELNTLHLTTRTKTDGDVNIMSSDELAKVALQLPTSEIQKRYEEELDVNHKVETEIPACFQDDTGIITGHAELKGEQHPIYIPTSNYDEMFRTYVFQGSPRMGKDTAIKNFVVEACLNHGIGSIIPDAIMEDGHRGMADGIRDALPPDKVIDIDLSNTDYPVPLDMTEIIKKLGRNGMNRFALEIIDFFGDVEDMGQSRTLLREFAKASRGNIHDIKLLLEDESYREKRIEEMQKEGNHRTADALSKWISEYGTDKDGNPKLIFDAQKKLDGKASALLNRLDEFLGDDALLNIFAQESHPDFSLEKWMQEGKVVIFRVPNRKLGAPTTRTLVHWITLLVFMTRMLMPANTGTFIIFNEPHQFMSSGLQRLLQRIMLEGPKWRLSALWALHHVGLLPRSLQDDLLSSSVNWFLFANSHKGVYQALEEELQPDFTIESAMTTPAYHSICSLQFSGRRQPPFLARMLPPPTDRYSAQDNSFLTARHSRMFGRKWTDVEKMIVEKERGA